MGGLTQPHNGNHAKLFSGFLRTYRGVVVALLVAGVITAFQTRELVIKIVAEQATMKETLRDVVVRQWDMELRMPRELRDWHTSE